MIRWISVTKKLPLVKKCRGMPGYMSKPILIWGEDVDYGVGNYMVSANDKKFSWWMGPGCSTLGGVTHWASLNPPPRKGGRK